MFMSKIENKGQIDYWLDQVKKTKEEDEEIAPFLGYSQIVGLADLRMLDEGFTIAVGIGDKKISWKNYGSNKYCISITKN